MALGPSAGPSNAGSIEGVNYRLVKLLKEMKGKRLGVVVIDFFEEPKGLIDLLLDF
jgi:1-phosphatidylinositol phosphodiesterase